MTRILLIVAGLLLISVQHYLITFTAPAQLIIFLAGIVCLGIPHGAADLLIAGRNAEERKMPFSIIKFLFGYVSRLILFGVVLWVFPLSGNLIFICFAAYHFGETDLYQFKTETLTGKVLVVGYGLVILAAILLHHFSEVTPLLLTFPSGAKNIGIIHWIDFNRFKILLGCIGFFVFGVVNYFYRYGKVRRKHAVVLLQFATIVYILYQLPMILAFSFYFILWHSVFSIINIVEYLRKNGSLSYKKILGQIALFSILAIAGMCSFGLFGFMFVNANAITGYVFLSLAVLTPPHMQVMHNMYRNIRNHKAATKPYITA